MIIGYYCEICDKEMKPAQLCDHVFQIWLRWRFIHLRYSVDDVHYNEHNRQKT